MHHSYSSLKPINAILKCPFLQMRREELNEREIYKNEKIIIALGLFTFGDGEKINILYYCT
jgi:hypothetical protein